MHTKEMKLAQKLIRKNQNHDGIVILLKAIGKIIESDTLLVKGNQALKVCPSEC
jgi:hypothetical protein